MTPHTLIDASANWSSGSPAHSEWCQAARHNLHCCRGREGILLLPLL